MKHRGWIAVACCATACAAASGAGGRKFNRSGVSDVKLETLDVVVVVAPVQTTGPQLNVPVFQPPTSDEVLLSSGEDPGTRDELIATLRANLAGRGFKARFIHAGVDDAPAIAPAPPIDTSTVSVAPGGPMLSVDTASGAASKPEPPRGGDVHLASGETLEEIRSRSTADGVLVVRVVPVDAFYILELNPQNNIVNPATGNIDIALSNDRPVAHSGRLMFGQAFLFDRVSGLRLWTRNLPDMPDSNRLTPEAPMLEYGYVTPDGQAELPVKERAQTAANKFVRAMFSDFVVPSRGNGVGRARLDAIDVEAEAAEQAFLDEGWVGVGVDLGWTAESAGASFTLGEERDMGPTIDPLGTGALAPSGVLRATPRLSILSPGGFAFGVAIPIGIGPGSFSRTYHFDNQSPEDNTDRGALVAISGPTTVGLEVMGGYMLTLSPQLKLLPGVGVFGEAWFLDTSPVVDDNVHLRLGLIGRLDVIYRASASSALFFRAGPNLRLGIDTAGPAVLGAGLNVGIGVFL